ncbi:MAG: S41 family peptidase, partial [Candidatus Zixiibacteriota bacterium]
MHLRLVLTALLFVTVMPAAAVPQDSASCDCQAVFDNLTQSLEQNYIGYALQKESLQKSFDVRVDEFRARLKDTSVLACVSNLQDFLTFFHDGHLFVSQRPKYSEADNNRIKPSLIQLMYDPARVKSEVSQNRTWGTDLVGIWTDGTTRYAIIKNDKPEWPYEYAAVCIQSPKPEKVGELKIGVNLVKGKYVGVYFSNDYSPRYTELALAKDTTLLGIWGGLLWGKVQCHRDSIMTAPLYDPTLPTVARFDSTTVLLTIPTFLVDKKVLDSVLMANAEILTTSRYLIIDIRGNSGGNGIYYDLMSLYANRPLTSEIGLALASTDNLAYFTRFARDVANDPYQPVVADMKANMGKIVKGPRFSTADLPKIPSQIQKVAILTDASNVSAAETFILHSKLASDKVVTIGSNTGGVVDYNNINMVRVSCE